MTKRAKAHVKLGVGSVVGMSALGAVSGGNNPGLVSIASQGINLANVGQLGKTGMGIMGDISKSRKVSKCRVVNKFL